MATKKERIGTLIAYKLTDLSQSERNRFCRKFLGWKGKSQYSKYTYTREGFIDDIPHVRVDRAIFIFRKEDAEGVLSFFREHDVKIFARDVILEKSDADALENKGK